MLKRRLTAGIIGSLLTAYAFAVPIQASFDCTKAATATDKLICSNNELANLDKTLATAYGAAKLAAPEKATQLVQEQRLWLKHDRNLTQCKLKSQNPTDVPSEQIACMQSIYQQRITALGNQSYLLSPKLQAYLNRLTLEQFKDLGDNKQNAFACPLFKINPNKAYTFYYSISPLETSFNEGSPMCSEGMIDDKIPDMKLVEHALQPMLGAQLYADTQFNTDMCIGHGMHAADYAEIAREFYLIQAATDPYPNTSDTGLLTTGPRNIELWAQQGLFERRHYEALQKTVAKVMPELENYYMQTFHVDSQQAATAAKYYMDEIIWTYTETTDVNLGSSYPTYTFMPNDLESYLKTHQLPKPTLIINSDKIDTSDTDNLEPIVLRRLLSLAIINDYPTTILQQLITAGAAINVEPDKNTLPYTDIDTPLMLAAGRADAIQLLLQAGANPNSQNWFGKTALMYAVQEQDMSGIHLLIKAGANVNLTTAPHWEGEDDDNNQNNTYTYYGIACSGIKAGSRTALMYAAWQGTPAIIQLLIAAHANIHAQDSVGHTAYDYLAKNTLLNAAQQQAMKTLLKG